MFCMRVRSDTSSFSQPMSSSYPGRQFDAFTAKRLCNWEVPAARPSTASVKVGVNLHGTGLFDGRKIQRRQGSTKPIVDERGHLLPGVARINNSFNPQPHGPNAPRWPDRSCVVNGGTNATMGYKVRPCLYVCAHLSYVGWPLMRASLSLVCISSGITGHTNVVPATDRLSAGHQITAKSHRWQTRVPIRMIHDAIMLLPMCPVTLPFHLVNHQMLFFCKSRVAIAQPPVLARVERCYHTTCVAFVTIHRVYECTTKIRLRACIMHTRIRSTSPYDLERGNHADVTHSARSIQLQYMCLKNRIRFY